MTHSNASKKIQQDRVMTAIVGFSFYDLEKSMGTAEFQKRLEPATVEAIADQNASGIDLVTAGEDRRDHYMLYVLRKMAGMDKEDDAFAH